MENRPSIVRAIGAGFIATTVMTAFLYLGVQLQSSQANFLTSIGGVIVPTDGTFSSTYLKWAGLIWHYNFGTIIFPHLYVLAYYPMLPGNLFAKGMGWGTILWLFAVVIGLPLMDYGIFATKTSSPVLISVGLLAVHWVYGLLFSYITGAAKKKAEEKQIRTPILKEERLSA